MGWRKVQVKFVLLLKNLCMQKDAILNFRTFVLPKHKKWPYNKSIGNNPGVFGRHIWVVTLFRRERSLKKVRIGNRC